MKTRTHLEVAIYTSMRPQMETCKRLARIPRRTPCKIIFQLTMSVVWILLAAMVTVGRADESKPLTNADVIKMFENRIPESVVISKVKSSKAAFDISTEAIIELNKKGISEKVLNAMLNSQGVVEKKATPETTDNDSEPEQSASTLPSEKPSALSYGTAAGLVKKGVTTQRDIIDLFGGADVMTTDRDGTEVWMYDKKTSVVSSSGSSSDTRQETSEASKMAKYLGIPLFAGIGSSRQKGQTESVGNSLNTGEVKSSSKTITFIIKFNENKTVKDFAVRQASY